MYSVAHKCVQMMFKQSQIWLICRECRQLLGLAFLVFTWWGSSGCHGNRGICLQEASHPGVNLLPYSPIHVQWGYTPCAVGVCTMCSGCMHHVQWGYAPCAVGVCTNNLVFATTLFARHNFAHLSRYFATAFHCRAAQEHFLYHCFCIAGVMYNLWSLAWLVTMSVFITLEVWQYWECISLEVWHQETSRLL